MDYELDDEKYIVSVCHDCLGIFETRQQLFEHKRKYIDPNANNNKIYECDVTGCNRIFPDLRTLNKHKNTHFKPFKCLLITSIGTICNKSFSNKRNLTIHQRSHNDDRREKCRFCQKKFCDPSTLKKHIKCIHSKVTEKQFVCKLCHKKFAKKHSLEKHFEIHSNLMNRKQFECHLCDKIFTVKSNRNRHLKKVHHLNKI